MDLFKKTIKFDIKRDKKDPQDLHWQIQKWLVINNVKIHFPVPK